METIGDAYMAVGGAPVKDVLHAARTCDMAMDMVDAIQDLTDPSTGRHPHNLFLFLSASIFVQLALRNISVFLGIIALVSLSGLPERICNLTSCCITVKEDFHQKVILFERGNE